MGLVELGDDRCGTWSVPGAAPGLFVLGRPRLLRPDEQVFEAMLAGWRAGWVAAGTSSFMTGGGTSGQGLSRSGQEATVNCLRQ